MTNHSPLVLHVFPSFEVGGSQRRLVTYLNTSEAQFDHQVYAMDGCYAAGDLIRDFKRADIADGAIPKGSVFKGVSAAGAQLRQIKPDLLICYNWGAIEWALAAGTNIPTVHVQDGFAEDEQTTEKPLRKLMRRFAYRRCKRVIVPSRNLEDIARKSWHIRPKNLTYIPNGIDLKLFSQAADPSLLGQLDITNDHMIVGTIARLKPEKNIGRLIEAFSRVEDDFPAARLVVVGDGVGMAALKMLAERICSEGRVIFTGNISEPERIVPAFDIFALSSDTEQMPISVLEAMAASKPIVSTDVGDVKRMVSETNRTYIADKSADTLARNITALLSDPALATYIGKENRKLAEDRYSETSMITAYDKVFSECLSM